MKKQKGFTLIELLAVIVVLSIILVIAVPKILDVIERAERKSFGESADLMGRAASLKYASSGLTQQIGNETYVYENNELMSSSPTLEYKGDKPKSGIIKQEKGKISFALISKNGKYCAIKKKTEKVSKVYDIKGYFEKDDCTIDYIDKLRYYITFDANHGHTDTLTKRVAHEEAYGELPEATREKHIFKGWYTEKTGGEKVESSTIVTKDKEHTLYAHWEELKYKVTFKNEDGTILQSEMLDVGEIPVYKGETPTKAATTQYTYTFKEWDKVIEAVLEDTEYIATYTSTKKDYRVIFKNEDGTVLQSEMLDVGEIPVYKGATPTKAATAQYTYTFNGWNKTIEAVLENTEYVATYTSETRKYNVTFKNGTTTYDTQTIAYGSSATKPSTNPSKDGYVFNYWSTSSTGSEYNFATKITGNTTLYAVYVQDPTKCPSNNVTVGSSIVCKRATSLHIEVCSGGGGCNISSQYNIGDQMMYGNCGTRGTLTSGDAFDCDVNGDGTYDSATERFYYLSDYYNTSTKQFESDTAVLIYYNNTVNGVANNKVTGNPSYNDNANVENYTGPTRVKTHLPTTSQWRNVSLKNTTRVILNEINTNVSYDNYDVAHQLPTSFSYSGYATRPLTLQELKKSCGVDSHGASLKNCNYLLENSRYFSQMDQATGTGYWLETVSSNYWARAYTIEGRFVSLHYYMVNGEGINVGVRPVIEVPKSKINY